MRITEVTGVEAIELMADLMVPLTKILGDRQIAENKDNTLEIIKYALKNHSADCLDLMVISFGEEARDYNTIQMFNGMVQIFTDPYMQDLFIGQVQEIESSGLAMEGTEEV